MPPGAEHRFSTAEPYCILFHVSLLHCMVYSCHAFFISQFPFYLPAIPNSDLSQLSPILYIYFTYIKYYSYYTVYKYIWYVHIYIALLLSQAAAGSCCKEFSNQAHKTVAELKDPYCMYRNTPVVMGTSTSAPTTGCKGRGLHLKRFRLSLHAHILLYFECMRIFPSELILWSYFGSNFTSN